MPAPKRLWRSPQEATPAARPSRFRGVGSITLNAWVEGRN
jgi:hypothetical protein